MLTSFQSDALFLEKVVHANQTLLCWVIKLNCLERADKLRVRRSSLVLVYKFSQLDLSIVLHLDLVSAVSVRVIALILRSLLLLLLGRLLLLSLCP